MSGAGEPQYLLKITSQRTGAIGYIDRRGVPYSIAADAGRFQTEDAAREAFDTFASDLIRITGHCRWTCEVLGVYRCQECRTEYTYTGARMLDCPYCAGSPEYEAALRVIDAGGGAS